MQVYWGFGEFGCRLYRATVVTLRTLQPRARVFVNNHRDQGHKICSPSDTWRCGLMVRLLLRPAYQGWESAEKPTAQNTSEKA